jgi:hypothetical protein
MYRRRLLFVLLGLAPGLMAPGCSQKSPTSPEQSLRQTELKQIWEVYTSYVTEKKRAPTSRADVQGYGTAFSEGMRALKGGQCVVIWGVADPMGASANRVLAYDKETPHQGGLVVFGNGTVKTLTAEEFQTAPKAEG